MEKMSKSNLELRYILNYFYLGEFKKVLLTI